MLSLLDLTALLLVFSALFEWLNKRYFALPSSIGLLGMGLLASLMMVALEVVAPGETVSRKVAGALLQIDFEATVMNGLLAFLLFAGALHLDVGSLRGRAVPVAVMATIGVLVSTTVIGVGLWVISGPLGYPVPLIWALVFGALISPTDPVAVLSTLKAVAVPQSLETDMKGESLFNDGVGVVVFSMLLAIAEGERASASGVALLFAREAVGGVALGVLTGFVAYRMTRRIDEYAVEVMLSLALATGTYALAQALHTSGADRGGGGRAGAGQQGGEPGHERADADVRVRVLGGDRLRAELDAVPADRARSADPAVRRGDDAGRARCGPAGAGRAILRGRRRGRRAALVRELPARGRSRC